MKDIKWLSVVLLVLLMACEKVIDVDLDESEPQLVIEAKLNEGENLFEVYVSKTSPYFENEPSEKINAAIINLSDDQG